MDENISKVQEKLETVSELVDKFGAQSKQLYEAEKELNSAKKSFESTVEKVLYQGNTMIAESKKWYEKATSDLLDLCCDCTDSFDSIKSVLEEKNFNDLCVKLSALTKVLSECTELKNELENIKIRQAEDRKFMESKFAELFEKLNVTDAPDDTSKNCEQS